MYLTILQGTSTSAVPYDKISQQKEIVGAVPQCPAEMDIKNQREGMETLPYDIIWIQKTQSILSIIFNF